MKFIKHALLNSEVFNEFYGRYKKFKIHQRYFEEIIQETRKFCYKNRKRTRLYLIFNCYATQLYFFINIYEKAITLI